ncbi:hypothetical protein GGS23DRAFT_553910 [Durotheca rogersii]|uniref:uncharacterized protein n=1 Tax=Durotheca rogersii TaxID=419775 RepID=UPI0022202B09|nr:uncharacterized protein GGS23DRAFT_553910 [Durotheca rogersii]KAI5865718.1 hypothetical protein GGS23DRAFT_553910 [Durotheca rogersii]
MFLNPGIHLSNVTDNSRYSIPAAVMPGGSDKQDATSHKRTNHKAPQNALSSQGKVAATSDLQGSVVDLKASENDSDDDDDDDDDDVKNSYLGAHFGAMNGKHTANRLCAPRVKDTVATRAPEAEDGSDHQSAAEHPTQEAPQRLGRPRKRKDAPPASDGNKDSRPAKKTKVPRRGPEAGATPSRHSTRAAALLAASSIAQQNVRIPFHLHL